MTAVLPPQLAFVFSSLCVGGILGLMALVAWMSRDRPSGSDGCLAFVFSLLLATAAIAALNLAF